MTMEFPLTVEKYNRSSCAPHLVASYVMVSLLSLAWMEKDMADLGGGVVSGRG